jgi:hypothetical protein
VTYNGLVQATWTRLAAMLLVAVVCADLVGVDCARLSAESTATAACGSACSESPDCLCCSVADETVHMPPGGGGGRISAACYAPLPAPVDGVRPVPYRPPLSQIPPSIL